MDCPYDCDLSEAFWRAFFANKPFLCGYDGLATYCMMSV